MITFHLFNLFKLYMFLVFLGAKEQIPPVAVSKQDPGVFFWIQQLRLGDDNSDTPGCLWWFLKQARFRPRFWKLAPENGCEYDGFLFGMPYFSGAMLGRVAFLSLGPLGSLAAQVSLTHQDPSSGCNLELGRALLW